jgi:hypothetical protein
VSAVQILAIVRPLHEAETGGGPAGLGWGSFVVASVGVVVVLRVVARYLAARRGGGSARSAGNS